MKKIIYLLLSVLPLVAIFTSCENRESIVFDYEKPQFDTKEDAILIEIIVPQTTMPAEDIYIVGDFNGGNVAAGQLQWKLEKSPDTDYRWGIYLYPSTFINGKTLADGYHFTSLTQGDERTVDNQAFVHYATGKLGERVNETVVRWENYFKSLGDWPVVPANKIMLKLNVPDYTPENSKIVLYGFINNWDGSHEKWKATMLSPAQYYLFIDPFDFAGGTDLGQQFKFALVQSGKEWWYHQDNLDGSDEDGPGHTIEQAILLKQEYELNLIAWARKEDIKEEDGEENGITIRWRQTDGVNWSEMAIYVWDGTPTFEQCGEWPGVTVTADENGWYKFTFPEGETPGNIIFNNKSGAQLDGPSGLSSNACCEIISDGGALSYQYVDCEVSNGITIKWRMADEVGWNAMAIYVWDGSPTFEQCGAWPGKKVTPDKNGWYSFTFPEGETPGNVIFNNTNGGDDNQIDGPSGLTSDACFEITSTTTYTAIDCP